MPALAKLLCPYGGMVTQFVPLHMYTGPSMRGQKGFRPPFLQHLLYPAYVGRCYTTVFAVAPSLGYPETRVVGLCLFNISNLAIVGNERGAGYFQAC